MVEDLWHRWLDGSDPREKFILNLRRAAYNTNDQVQAQFLLSNQDKCLGAARFVGADHKPRKTFAEVNWVNCRGTVCLIIGYSYKSEGKIY